MAIKEFRAQYPEYGDVSDEEIAARMYAKHKDAYQGMSEPEFKARFLGGAGGPTVSSASKPTPSPALPTTPSEVFTAVPKLAFGAVKNMAQDLANYPQARLLDPAVQSYRSLRGMAEQDPAKRALNARPTPEEAQRDQSARAFETSMAAGPVAERLAGATVGRLPGLLGRFLKNSAVGATLGGTDAGIRENSLAAVPAGAVGGALVGGPFGEVVHGASRVSAKPTAPKTAFPPVEEGVSPFVRMTAKEGPDKGAASRGLRTLVRGYHSPEPLAEGHRLSTGESLPDAMTLTRRQQQDAEEQASVETARWWRARLKGTGALKPDQMDLIRQHATAESFLSDVQQGKPLPEGYTPKQLEHDYTESAIKLSENPEVQKAFTDYRSWYEGRHQSVKARGYGTGYQKGYTPIQGLADLEGLLPQSVRFGRTPAFMRERGQAASLRSSDVPKLMARYETQFKRKMAEDDLFTKLQGDPKINLAATPEGQARLKKDGMPEGYFQFDVPAGSPGHGKTGPNGEELPFVVHRDVAEALSRFYPPVLSDAERMANKVGNAMAQGATTLNPMNRAQNIPSDLAMMLSGPAGEKGTFTSGIAARRLLRYPSALGSMLKGSFGGRSLAAEEGRRVGGVSGTFQKEIEGVPIPHDMSEYYAKEKPSAGKLLKSIAKAPYEGMRRFSMATEAAPRVAASQEAAKRGLPFGEQQRLAHESSLPYGSGSPLFAKSKLAKLLSRFSTYPALADVRIAKGLTTPGSITRYAALSTIPPAAAAEWNTQSDEYAGYEKRLKPWVKNSLHVNHRAADGTWSTYVVRIDPFSEMQNRIGLGQLSGRVVKAAKGVEPLSLKSAPKDALNAYANLYPIGPIIEDVAGETKFGKPLDTPMKKLANLNPVLRLGAEAMETATDQKDKHGNVKKGDPKKALQMILGRTAGGGVRQYDEKNAVEKKKAVNQ